LTPHHAKRLVNALAENIRRYESQFGEVKDQQSTAMPFNFGPPGEA